MLFFLIFCELVLSFSFKRENAFFDYLVFISLFFDLCVTSQIKKKPRQLSAMDLLALASMKNAAKCDT